MKAIIDNTQTKAKKEIQVKMMLRNQLKIYHQCFAVGRI